MTPGILTMLRRIPPVTVLAAALVFGLAAMAMVLMFTLGQPWLGLKLVAAPDGTGATVIQAYGPASEIPVGTELEKVEGASDSMLLETLDLTIEPDGVIPNYDTYRRFIARQERLAGIQKSAEIKFTATDGRIFRVVPDLKGRSLSAIPPDFWVGLAVGLIAWLVSAAVFAFRPGDAGARYLLLSGVATLIFAPAAAIYTTRELAVDGTVFRWASDLNFFGGSLFAASFVALLLYYPRRLAPAWVGIGVVMLFVVWFVLQQLDVFQSMTFARRFLVMLGVLATFVLAGVHWFGTRRDPVARAALQWFLLSWLLGTGIFALFILLPQSFGVDTTPVQGYAFLLFLLVYGGLAFGILRYRLFELGDWWRRIVIWAVSVLFLILLDLFFLFGLHLSSGASLGWSLLACGVLWLPFRAWVWGRFSNNSTSDRSDLFARVMDIALASSGGDAQGRMWSELLKSIFDPLQITVSKDPVDVVTIKRDGLALIVPAVGSIPGVRLEFARGGRRLFTPRDAGLARELVTMLGHGMESRSAYGQGVAEERSRIARDMHDNIGAQLLAALHSRDAASKDSKIRETLADLRDVINNASSDQLAIDETFAELRVETADRLGSAGIALRWKSEENDGHSLSAAVTHALRSIVREAVSNVIRHSGASQVVITVQRQPGMVSLEILDNGSGFDFASVPRGNGLSNMHARLEHLGGTLQIENTGSGMRLAVNVPIN